MNVSFQKQQKIKLKDGTTKPYEHWVTEEMCARYKKRQAQYRVNNKEFIKKGHLYGGGNAAKNIVDILSAQ